MSFPSPILPLFQQAGAFLAPYGPDDRHAVEVVQSFGPLELEYAAVRKHCVLLDQPQRAMLEVTGPDRIDFLNRMLTQELKGMAPYSLRRSFWLNRKGRIDADLRVIELPDRTMLECDVHAAARTVEGLGSYIVMEDAAVRDITSETHRMSLHGAKALALLPHFAAAREGSPSHVGLADRSAAAVRMEGVEAVVFRDDTTGEPGLELVLPSAEAKRIYTLLIERAGIHDGHAPLPVVEPSGTAHESGAAGGQARLRPAGWHAFNIARIEAGSPLYLIDFGPDSLPAESGVLMDRVSFTKGCYLGQEIVARMHARGHPKQQLVAVRFEVSDTQRDAETGLYPQPVTGAPLSLEGGDGQVVGAVTSSTLAPMLGSTPIAFAQVKWDHIAPGTRVSCRAEGSALTGTIQPSLRFWSRDGSGGGGGGSGATP